MDSRTDVLVLGLGNVLWADEGFGVRAVEALHAALAFPEGVVLQDGGTLGMNLYGAVAAARRLLVFDAVDFRLPPGTLKVFRDDEVPAWGAAKLSPHQTGFNDVLGLAQFHGLAPERITVIGVQPVELMDFGGSLRDPVKARVPEAVDLAARELADWGFPGRRRDPAETVVPLNSTALALDAYERDRPAPEAACRIGDARVLERTKVDGGDAPCA
jgi:hydrogenase maturation protease